MLRPIVKWVGGKRQVMDQIIKNFPAVFNNYHEPFVGGGSVFMELYNSNLLDNKKIYISDILDPLMNLYFIIKHAPDGLINELKKDLYKNDKDVYNMLRIEFNNIKKKIIEQKRNGIVIKENELIYYASLFLYLNKTNFNGIYRENLKGMYNIPFGKQKNPIICNEELIRRLHIFFNNNNIIIKQCDYINCENDIKEGDFVYIDPPYYNTFNNYSNINFKRDEQIKLMEFFKRLTAKGCKIALSNSDDIFIREIYKDILGVKIKEISVRRMVNSDVEGRKELKKELLITNY